jgi:hypothetical protein
MSTSPPRSAPSSEPNIGTGTDTAAVDVVVAPGRDREHQ